MVPQKSAVKQFVRVYAFIYDESLVQGKVLDDTVPVFVSGMVRYGLRYIIEHRRYFKNICIVYSIERRKQTVGITAVGSIHSPERSYRLIPEKETGYFLFAAFFSV